MKNNKWRILVWESNNLHTQNKFLLLSLSFPKDALKFALPKSANIRGNQTNSFFFLKIKKSKCFRCIYRRICKISKMYTCRRTFRKIGVCQCGKFLKVYTCLQVCLRKRYKRENSVTYKKIAPIKLYKYWIIYSASNSESIASCPPPRKNWAQKHVFWESKKITVIFKAKTFPAPPQDKIGHFSWGGGRIYGFTGFQRKIFFHPNV